MKTKKIYLMRHGQTKFNRLGIVQGRGVDSSLNAEGQSQAEKFYRSYHSVPFDKVYTSSLRRTKESVAGFLDNGIGHTMLDGLDEIHWGSKEGKRFSESDHQYYLDVTTKWRQGKTDVCIAGGESPDDVWRRQQKALNQIMANAQEQLILICMHGRAIRIFMCLLLNYDLRYMDMFPHHNTGLYKITYTGNYFRVDIINSLQHLK